MSDNCIYVDEGEPFEVFEANIRVARKVWTCCECGNEIKPGYPYEHAHGLYDGQWDDYRTCIRCVDVAEGFFQGRMYGAMVDDFEAAHDFDYRDGIPKDFTPCNAAPTEPVPQDPGETK